MIRGQASILGLAIRLTSMTRTALYRYIASLPAFADCPYPTLPRPPRSARVDTTAFFVVKLGSHRFSITFSLGFCTARSFKGEGSDGETWVMKMKNKRLVSKLISGHQERVGFQISRLYSRWPRRCVIRQNVHSRAYIQERKRERGVSLSSPSLFRPDFLFPPLPAILTSCA